MVMVAVALPVPEPVAVMTMFLPFSPVPTVPEVMVTTAPDDVAEYSGEDAVALMEAESAVASVVALVDAAVTLPLVMVMLLILTLEMLWPEVTVPMVMVPVAAVPPEAATATDFTTPRCFGQRKLPIFLRWQLISVPESLQK